MNSPPSTKMSRCVIRLHLYRAKLTSSNQCRTLLEKQKSWHQFSMRGTSLANTSLNTQWGVCPYVCVCVCSQRGSKPPGGRLATQTATALNQLCMLGHLSTVGLSCRIKSHIQQHRFALNELWLWSITPCWFKCIQYDVWMQSTVWLIITESVQFYLPRQSISTPDQTRLGFS